jgi:N-hydroxyarylamine O-acetyltransferase
MDVEKYLRRIQYRGPSIPTAESLRELHRQHLYTVPFENLDIALGNPIILDVDLLFEKIVTRRRGGFCYELNGLFCGLLRALGFRVDMLSARVRRADGSYSPEFDHMLLKVELDEPWLADVGFGESFIDPIPLRSGATAHQNGHRYSVLSAEGQWQLVRHGDDRDEPLYIFTDQPRDLRDFESMCNYHQTSPDSHFTKGRVCTVATPDGRITLSGMRLIVTRDGRREESLLGSHAELGNYLRDRFGIVLASDSDLAKLAHQKDEAGLLG